jgi:hypothetical protein
MTDVAKSNDRMIKNLENCRMSTGTREKHGVNSIITYYITYYTILWLPVDHQSSPLYGKPLWQS